MNWKKRRVYFDDKGISRESYDPVSGTFGAEYITFELESTVNNKVGDYIAKYKCYVAGMQMIDNNGQWANLSGQQQEVEFDMLTRIDMYSVLGKPTTPWYVDKTSTRG